mmetsp:Transcript_1807/g.5944  ORF Transcript_1807/g.5944 Transcript_1807/m.5944 type:complete len:263 (-) Transcript_1807:559-1347(-)|eukprot:scaffold2104_cov120-Isochrysis_galbana.AAC.2
MCWGHRGCPKRTSSIPVLVARRRRRPGASATSCCRPGDKHTIPSVLIRVLEHEHLRRHARVCGHAIRLLPLLLVEQRQRRRLASITAHCQPPRGTRLQPACGHAAAPEQPAAAVSRAGGKEENERRDGHLSPEPRDRSLAVAHHASAAAILSQPLHPRLLVGPREDGPLSRAPAAQQPRQLRRQSYAAVVRLPPHAGVRLAEAGARGREQVDHQRGQHSQPPGLLRIHQCHALSRRRTHLHAPHPSLRHAERRRKLRGRAHL